VVVVGDAVVYYPAGSTGSIVIFHRAGIKAHEVFRFGLIMTVIAIAVVFAVLPYWKLVGEPLVR
jgi:di/tricarboxylate transporter